MQIRHDINGFYICTQAEADWEDCGNASVGFDGREHFDSIEDARKALTKLRLDPMWAEWAED